MGLAGSQVDLYFKNGAYDDASLSAPTDSAHLLLHMDGADASTAFIDATGRHGITVAGNAQIDTAQSKFGGASGLFDGTGDFLTLVGGISDFAFGTGDFTIDFWVRFNGAPVGTNAVLYRMESGGSDILQIFHWTNIGAIAVSINGSVQISGTTAPASATWYHVAVTRNSGSLKLFINGTQEGSTFTDSFNYINDTGPFIGAQPNGTNGLNGWLDEYRVLKGTAAWTSNFTPPTAAYNVALSGPYAHLSCSRASIGYAQTVAGTLTQFAANALRITDKGLLVEDARTNVILQSADATTTWYTLQAAVTANQAVAPDGTTTMDLITEDTSTHRHGIEQQFGPYTTQLVFSCFVKDVDRRYVQIIGQSDTGGRIYLIADLQTGTITDSGIQNNTGTTVFTSASIESFSNGIYRLVLVGTPTTGGISADYFDIILSNAPTLGTNEFGCQSYTGTSKSIYAWGMQVEQASFASSYIPTTTAAATRAADTVTCFGSLTSVLGGAALSLVIDVKLSASLGYDRFLGCNGEQYSGLQVAGGSVDQGTAYDAIDLLNCTYGNSLTAFTGVKVGYAQNNSPTRSFVGGGGTVATDAHGMIGFGSTTHIAQNGNTSGTSFSLTRRFTVWTSKLADATLQQLTSPFDSVPNFNMPMMGF